MYNTEQHIRVFESLLKGGDWGEKLPDFMDKPGKIHFLLNVFLNPKVTIILSGLKSSADSVT